MARKNDSSSDDHDHDVDNDDDDDVVYVDNDDDDDDDDDEDDEDYKPMRKIITSNKKPVRRNTKRTTVLQRDASKKTHGQSDESPDDEPLINLVKKINTGRKTKTKTKAAAPKKRNSPRKPRKMPVLDLSSNSSDDEPLIKAAKHPQVTKILRIILERCDGDDGGPTGSLTKKQNRDSE
ncbi:probable ATP-dependent RNA helicase ddx52 [Seriola lalandi dorsalis]|uniref:probable ATP-dependent RNA helicase ddx52 n=1 Tax=Seriola lalandi dorsalis TaxID=1841481 RepID=UPI000C6F8C4C|nr:probable ATP-dependent RNA helicase ddx52 [Seriola lalandi dorsalis]